MNKEIVRQLAPEMVELYEQGKCPFCAKLVDKSSFRDSLSAKEFKISGLCQKCQDKTFGKE